MDTKIAFSTVLDTPKKFSLELADGKFFGEIYRKQGKYFCKGQIIAKLNYTCNLCGDDIVLELDENTDFLLSDGLSKEQSLDVFEFFDGYINLNEIYESEIGAFLSDYHYCKKCQKYKEEGE